MMASPSAIDPERYFSDAAVHLRLLLRGQIRQIPLNAAYTGPQGPAIFLVDMVKDIGDNLDMYADDEVSRSPGYQQTSRFFGKVLRLARVSARQLLQA